MKIVKILLVVSLFTFTFSSSAQQEESANQDYVGFLSLEEFSNLHIWIDNKVNEMKLDQELQTEYDTFFLYYTGKFGKLGEKENEFPTKEAFEKNMDIQINKLNEKVTPLLTEEQNKIHMEIISNLERSLKNKLSQITNN